MRPLLSFLLLSLIALPAFADVKAPQGHVLVTLGGALSETNLPARSGTEGGLFDFHDIAYEKAVGFDEAMLNAMDQLEIRIPYGPKDHRRDISFSGPLLSDVMRSAGAEGKTALPLAMDGYQSEITWESIKAHQPILATHADGKPMGIGGFGPTMIVFPPTEDTGLADKQSGQQVWAIIYIGIQ
ncbi:MAG: hypothetical protein RDA78_22745 [Roseibium sp.]|uniref:hypothetical protein n=1 Tax=Roseibium sp. TaxID=1936156 RepID=UPI003D9C1C26